MASKEQIQAARAELARRELAKRATVPKQSNIGQLASGTTEGIANILGLPVDALSSAMRSSGLDIPPSPVGGAESIKNLLSSFIGGAPESPEQQVLRRVGQEVGAAAIPGGGLATRSTAPGRFLAGETGLAALGGGAAGVTEQAGGGELAQLAAQIVAPLTAVTAATAVPALTRRALTGGEAGRQKALENVQAFQQAGAEPSVAQALQGTQGGFPTQALTTGVGKVPGGQGVIKRFAESQAEQLGAKAGKIAAKISPRQDIELAGLTIKKGILDEGGVIDRFKSRGNMLYNQVDEFIPPGSQVPATNSGKLLDELAAPIPGAEAIGQRLTNPVITGLRDDFAKDLVDGTLPYEAIKGVRSKIGRMLTGAPVADVPRAELKQLYGALSKDMEGAAKLAGPGAEQAAKKANDFWKKGIQSIDDVFDRISKKVEPEMIYSAIESGDKRFSTVRTVMRSLRPKERDVVASTMLQRLGQVTAGQADEFGEGFSAARFLTNWNKVGPKTRRMVFSSKNSKRYAQDINALAKAGNIVKQGASVIANPSGTATQAINIGTGVAAVGGGLLSPAIPAIAAIGVLGANSASKLLTSPKAVRFIVSKSKLPVDRFLSLGARVAEESDDPELQTALEEYLGAVGGQ